MANHPDLGKVYNIWGKQLLMHNTLSTRYLELVVLRVAWLVKSAYEWHNHVGYAMNAGLTFDEISAIRTFPEGGAWNAQDEAVLRSVGELIDNGTLSDSTWQLLGTFLDKRQMMDLVFSIGHYVMTSWALSSFGVEIEGGADRIGFDLKTASGREVGRTYKPGEAENWTETRGY
jgi:4-carboxymuconolactone decarboxylase